MSVMIRMLWKGKIYLLIIVWSAVLGLVPGVLQAEEGPDAGKDIVGHEVLKGDNLSLLAGYFYKDPRQWRRIYDLNKDVIDNPNLIMPGTVVRIRIDESLQWQIPYRGYLALIFN